MPTAFPTSHEQTLQIKTLPIVIFAFTICCGQHYWKHDTTKYWYIFSYLDCTRTPWMRQTKILLKYCPYFSLPSPALEIFPKSIVCLLFDLVSWCIPIRAHIIRLLVNYTGNWCKESTGNGEGCHNRICVTFSFSSLAHALLDYKSLSNSRKFMGTQA